MSVLITGGAGYIGSHCAALLRQAGRDVIVADSLATGHRRAVEGFRLYEGSIADRNFIDSIFEKEDIDSVIHFAAYSLVGESMTDPGKYFSNNTMGCLSLLEAMARRNVTRLVFSSTAAVYGQPDAVPITEDARTAPENPYGASKLMSEGMMDWFSRVHGIKYAALRYFNVAGAHGGLGEDHNPETHLIPIVLAAAAEKRDGLTVYGDDYLTDDGTCVRDYIHVRDLARAHLLALEYLEGGGQSGAFNLGNGQGFSVLEIIKAAERVLQKPIAYTVGQRRPGDPATLVASAEKAARVLGWTPEYTGVEQIIGSAWQWHKSQWGIAR